MEESQPKKAIGSQTDTVKCHVYLPEQMWGDTFKAILSQWKAKNITVKIRPFHIGETVDTDDIVDNTLQEAKKSLANGSTPVLVLPVGAVPRYACEMFRAKQRIKILAPAFKTRDDIFLILKRQCNGDSPSTAGILSKAQDLTTSLLMDVYEYELCRVFRDPIFNYPHENISGTTYKLPYKIRVSFPPRDKNWTDFIEKDFRNRNDLHCFIEAGPELHKYLNKPEEWLAIVNLNSWICRMQGLSYFTRALFCSLPEAFEDKHLLNLESFWEAFTSAGCEWLTNVKTACGNADMACAAGKTEDPFPMQSPAITNKKDQVTDLIHSIWSCTQLIRFAKECKFLKDFNPLKYSDFHVAKDYLIWELHRFYHPKDLFEKILKKCMKNACYPQLTDENLRKEFSTGINGFLEKVDYQLLIRTVTTNNITSVLTDKLIELVPGKNADNVTKDLKKNKKELEIAFRDIMKELKDE